jgi:predicted HicB family RNase H-like nuclease
MPNITLAIEEKTLKAARAHAKTEGMTLNGMIRKFLVDEIEGKKRMEKARKELLDLMEKSTVRLPKDYKFDREELYDSPEIVVPKELLEAARHVANDKKTTVNALVCDYLADVTDRKKRAKEAMAGLREMSLKTKARLGPDFKFDRASLYDG